MAQVKESRSQLMEKPTQVLKLVAEKQAWAAINQYFDGMGNGVEAKIACNILIILVRERQANNITRHLNIIEGMPRIEESIE